MKEFDFATITTGTQNEEQNRQVHAVSSHDPQSFEPDPENERQLPSVDQIRSILKIGTDQDIRVLGDHLEVSSDIEEITNDPDILSIPFIGEKWERLVHLAKGMYEDHKNGQAPGGHLEAMEYTPSGRRLVICGHRRCLAAVIASVRVFVNIESRYNTDPDTPEERKYRKDKRRKENLLRHDIDPAELILDVFDLYSEMKQQHAKITVRMFADAISQPTTTAGRLRIIVDEPLVVDFIRANRHYPWVVSATHQLILDSRPPGARTPAPQVLLKNLLKLRHDIRAPEGIDVSNIDVSSAQPSPDATAKPKRPKAKLSLNSDSMARKVLGLILRSKEFADFHSDVFKKPGREVDPNNLDWEELVRALNEVSIYERRISKENA